MMAMGNFLGCPEIIRQITTDINGLYTFCRMILYNYTLSLSVNLSFKMIPMKSFESFNRSNFLKTERGSNH